MHFESPVRPLACGALFGGKLNKDSLTKMDEKELEAYASVLGFTLVKNGGAESMRESIERRRERTATVRALGIDFKIPIKRAHDKRVVRLINEAKSDADLEEGMRMLLGDDQYAELAAACVEEDGTEDVDAMSYAVIAITGSEELKNF